MLELVRNLGARPEASPSTGLALDHEGRMRCRQRVTLDDGSPAGIFLPRGSVLSEGDVLATEDGRTLVRVRCLAEEVVTATAPDWPTLARGCFHLGNRHAPVQIGDLHVRLLPDKVLEDMLVRMGFTIRREMAPFVPEAGAYGDHGGHRHQGDLDQCGQNAALVQHGKCTVLDQHNHCTTVDQHKQSTTLDHPHDHPHPHDHGDGREHVHAGRPDHDHGHDHFHGHTHDHPHDHPHDPHA
ncbi:MAG: urease accessory protein UreE [Desulfovibrio sp.]|nr:urease accessory protein UreE [Desulfovibrio sp.]